MPRCYSAGGSALSFRGVLLFSIMPAVYIIIQRCYSQSFRGVLLYHAAGLIAYQVAGLLSIMPRGYSAGGSALSFRGVIVYHAGGFTSSFRGAYSQSCRAVLIVNHAARCL